ncbi:hypothetical protein PQR02_15005 [Paraburkholderia sediminicola]|uniref:Uncharacterized protein n=1 Tax=Paraburkholderia rhynchosiae TaxID=487049 RepID=A0ACC7NE10_9BURK
MSNDERGATVRALLAFADLRKSEEREFILTMNLLLRASPKKRREMIDQFREISSSGANIPGNYRVDSR